MLQRERGRVFDLKKFQLSKLKEVVVDERNRSVERWIKCD
jgi:hypothetical protein